jgi:hypothetical protein
MSQTSYSLYPATGRPGQLADLSNRNIISRVSDVDAPFGCVVSVGSDQASCKLPTASTDLAASAQLGVVMAQQALQSNATGVARVLAGNDTAIVHKGKVYVVAEQDMATSDPVFVRFATSVNTPALVQKGAIRKDADINATVATAAALTSARVLTGGTAGSIIVVELG